MAALDFSAAAAPVEGALDFSDSSVEAEQRSPSLLDYGKQAVTGYVADTARMLAYPLESAGIDYGRRMRESGDWLEQELTASMTPGGRRAATTPMFEGSGLSDLRPTDKWGQSLFMGAARSVPQMAMLAPVGAPIAGAVAKAIPKAATAATGLTGLLARNAPAGIGFGTAEGLQAGTQNASQTRTQVENTPLPELSAKSPRFRALLQDHDPETARQLLAKEAADYVFPRTALSTGAIGALTGGGAFGELYKDGGVVKGLLKGGLEEAAQETLQSGGEQGIQNVAERHFIDPAKNPWDQVVSQALTGGAIGGVTGGAFGGAAHIGGRGGQGEEDTRESLRKMRDLATKMREETARQTAERTAKEVQARAKAVGESTKEKTDDAAIVNAQAVAAGPEAPAAEAVAQAAAPQAGVLTETVDAAAHEAASSPENDRPEPTTGQIAANNAKLGHPTLDDMDVSIENPAGSIREDKKTTPPSWTVQLEDHYGYIRGTQGFDKDHLDVFIKKGTPKDWTGTYFVVNQLKDDGTFDEHKPMAGFSSEAEARAAYLRNYDDAVKAEKRISSVVPMPSQQFKAWAFDKTEKGPKGGSLKIGTIVPKLSTIVAKRRTATPIGESEVKLPKEGIPVPKLGTEERAAEIPADTHDMLRTMAANIGHLERGGKAMRAPSDFQAGGDVVGVTRWVGQPEWAKGLGATVREAQVAVEKAIAGKPLGAKQKDIVQAMLTEVAATRANLAGELEEAGATPEDAAAAAAEIEQATPPDPWPTMTEEEKNADLDARFSPSKAAGESQGDRQEAPAGEVRPAEAAEREPGQDDEEVAPRKEQAANTYAQVQTVSHTVGTSAPVTTERSKEVGSRQSSGTKNEDLAKPDASRPSLDLQGETEAEIQRKTAERAKVAEAERAKANAPTPGEFTLTGSERAADVGAAAGQQELAPVREEPEKPKDVEQKEPSANPIAAAADALIQAATAMKAAVEGKPAAPAGERPVVDSATTDADKAAVGGKPAAEKIADVGENLWYNRRNFTRGAVTWDGVKDLNDALKVKEVVKGKVWPKPDYAKLIEEGMQPFFARMLKQVYDGIATAPAGKSDADLERYIAVVGRVREAVFAWAKDNNENRAFIEEVVAKARQRMERRGFVMDFISAGGGMNDAILDRVWPFAESEQRTRRDRFSGNEERTAEARAIGGNRAIKHLQFTLDDAVAAMKDIDKGWPESQEAWQRQGIQVVEREKSLTVREQPQPGGRDSVWVVEINGRSIQSSKTAITAEDVFPPEAKWLVIDKRRKVLGWKETEEGAKDIAREFTKREAKGGDIRGMNISQAERQGPERRKGENVTSERLMEEFGFRGVNFGREGWINQAERQAYLNHAFDGLHDLAEIMDVPPKALSLNGMLGIAFGAQGRGGHAAAHFVPGHNEINLTKTMGAGTLAHEWGHALDHYFATQAGLAKDSEPFLSAHSNALQHRLEVRRLRQESLPDIRPEIMEAFKAVVETMEKRPMTEAETAAREQMLSKRSMDDLEKWIQHFRKDVELSDASKLPEFDKLADRLRQGDRGKGYVKAGGQTLTEPVARVKELIKGMKGQSTNIASNWKGLESNANHVAYKLEQKDATKEHVPQTTNTIYAGESSRKDRDKGGKPYWRTRWEMFARAFETYVSDRLAAAKQSNTFLSDAAMRAEARDRTGEGYANPYPRGEDRERINGAIDALVNAIEVKEEDGRQVMASRGAATQTPEFKRWFGDSKVVDADGNPLVVYHGSSESFDMFAPGHPSKKDGGWLGEGFYFSNRPDVANSYANLKVGSANPNVMPVFLSLKNPARKSGMDAKERLMLADLRGDKSALRAETKRLRDLGHDGIIWEPGYPDAPMEFVVFSPEQIKSATGNRGAFDPSDPDIRAARGAPAGGLTAPQVSAKLIEEFGAGIDTLIRLKILRLVARPESRDEGWYDPKANDGAGAAYLNAPALRPERVVPVLLHELGEHFNLPVMLGKEGYAGLQREVNALHTRGTSPVLEDAWRHVSENYDYADGSTQFLSEIIARVGETANGRALPWYKRLLNAVRAWLLERGFKRDTVKDLKDEDLRILVEASARQAIRKAGTAAAVRELIRGSQTAKELRSTKPGLWYSELQRKVRELKRGAGTAAEWKSAITALLGVKKDEIEWSGINEWLDMQEGKITKDQVLDFLDANGVRVEEKVLGDSKSQSAATSEKDRLVVELDALGYSIETAPDTHTGEDVIDGIQHRQSGYTFPVDGEGLQESQSYVSSDMLNEDGEPVAELPDIAPRVREIVNRLLELEPELPTADTSGTRYSQYTLPGGKNYRELLLTLPEKSKAWQVFDPREGMAVASFDTEAEAAADAAARGDSFDHGPRDADDNPKQFRSGHFDVHNILAHVRFKERVDSDGRRVLFLEELQSDWGAVNRRALDELSKPQSIGKLAENVFGAKLSAMMSLNEMDGGVLAALKHDQVRRAVVAGLPVDVMDHFRGGKATPENLFRDPDMFVAHLSGDHLRAVADGLLARARNVGARLRTELLAARNARSDREILPALNASDFDTRVVVGLLAPERLYHVGLLLDSSGSNAARDGAIAHSAETDVSGVTAERNTAVQANGRGVGAVARPGTEAARGSVTRLDGERGAASLASLADWHTDIVRRAGKSSAVKYTPGPFVGKTESYVSLILKRMIRWAAENGFDRVAWTTGEQQADRYDLSKQVEEIAYWNEEGGNYGVIIKVKNRGEDRGEDIERAPISGLELVDFVGKDVAAKIERGEGAEDGTGRFNDGVKVLSGLDLKVGGEGMLAFYNKIVPSVAKEVLKKLGGGQVGTVQLEFPETMNRKSGADVDGFAGAQPGFDITPEMREQALKGMPLFSRGHSNVAHTQLRSTPWPADGDHVVSTSVLTTELKAHKDYTAAKSGDVQAAARLVQDLFRPAKIREIRQRIGADAYFVPVISKEATGHNKIPLALAEWIAAALNTNTVDDVVQVNQPHHTGAKAMERLIARPVFDGKIEAGRKYALVDDVTTMGSTLSAMADHIAKQGGKVAGAVVLVNASRSATMLPSKGRVRDIERRYGDEVRELFGIEPAALNSAEATYILGFRDAQSLRDRATAAGDETRQRYAARGIPQEGEGGVKASRGGAPAWVEAQSADTQEALRKAGVYFVPPSLRERVSGWRDDWQKRVRQGLFDQFDPIKQYDYKAYMLARMTRASDAALEAILNYGTVRIDGDGAVDVDFESGGFLGILKKLHGEHDRFLAWVIGNRAERLLAEGREHNFTPQDVERLKDLNRGAMHDGTARPQLYASIRMELDRYNKAVLDVAENAGLIDADGRATWEKDFYVPFYRLMEEEGVKGPVPTKGLVNQYAFKVLKGGEQVLGDPLENVLRNWSHLLDASLKNQAARASLLAAERVGAVIEADEATARQIAKATANKRGAVSFVDTGALRWFVVEDAFLLDALKSIGFTGFSGPAMKTMQKFKRWLTLGVTVSPTFRIRNLIRDSLSMIGANPASYNVLGNVLTGWKATKEGTPEYASIIAGGGVMRFGTLLEGDRAEHVKRLIESGVPRDTILDSPNHVKAMLQKAWDWWQHVGDRAENVNRVALYKKLRSEGKTHLEASYAARDIMDFSMQGTWAAIRFLTQTVPFMNARLQGLYKLGRGAKEDPRRFGIVLGGTALASLALLLAYQDDDDWKAREDWDRETFWWFKIGDTAFRIPKPFEIGAIATLAERGYEAMATDQLTGREFADRVGSILMEQLSLNPVPQLAKPMIEVWANRDFFTDRPIETMGMERLSKDLRAHAGTSATAQLIGNNGLISPVQIDHLARGYFGWLGAHIVATADLALRPAMGLPAKPEWRVDEVLVLGDFARSMPAYQSKYVTKLYDQISEVQEAMADLRHLQQIGAMEEAREYLKENRDKIRLYRLYGHAERQLQKVNKQIKLVQQRAGTPEEKRERLDALYGMRNRVARLTVERARALEQRQ